MPGSCMHRLLANRRVDNKMSATYRGVQGFRSGEDIGVTGTRRRPYLWSRVKLTPFEPGSVVGWIVVYTPNAWFHRYCVYNSHDLRMRFN